MRDRGRLTGRGARSALAAALALATLAGAARPQTQSAGEAAPPAARDSTDSVSRLVYGLEYAEDPDISPDGAWIAYVLRRADRTRDRWHTEIVRARSDGSEREILTSGPHDRTPRFSPDGRRLAYVSRDEGFWELRVLSLATRRRRDLGTGSRPIGAVAWGPAGNRIAFLRHGSDLDGLVHLYVADLSGGAVRQLTSSGFPLAALPLDTPLSWTPDGSALLFSADPDLVEPTNDADSSRETAPRGLAAATAGRTDILEIPASGGSIRRVAARRGPDDDPAVSPDGRSVAFSTADPAAEGGRGARRLDVLSRSGGAPSRTVYAAPGLDVRRPVWSPDGRGLFALLEGRDRVRLALIALDGSVRTLAEGLAAGPTPAAGSVAYGVSADSANPRFVATATIGGSPGELVTGGRRPGDFPRRVTWINEGIDLEGLVAGEEIPVAPDLAARLFAPARRDDDASTGPPRSGILVVAGGCGRVRASGFDLELTALATTGRIVLALDPGASPDDVRAAADTLARRTAPGTPLFLLERTGDGSAARRVLARSDVFGGAVVHRHPDCGAAPARGAAGGAGERPADSRDAGDEAPARRIDPAEAAVLTLPAPAHPFDEPPSGLVTRLRRTLEWFGVDRHVPPEEEDGEEAEEDAGVSR